MFTLTIKTDNEAFSADPAAEITRIMRDVARWVRDGSIGGTMRDINGNTVGKWEYSEKMVEWDCPRCHTINEEPAGEPGDMTCVDCHYTL
jgi:hypothetical protein